MPRRTMPTVILALSPTEAARAFGIQTWRVRDAINAGVLIVREIGPHRRIAIAGDGGLQNWIETWPQAVTKKRN